PWMKLAPSNEAGRLVAARTREAATLASFTKPCADSSSSASDTRPCAWSATPEAASLERHVETAAREDGGPGAADQPRSDNCNTLIHSHSTFLLKSRSCFSKADAPVQVTEPRSEERRVGKECGSRWWREHTQKKKCLTE